MLIKSCRIFYPYTQLNLNLLNSAPARAKQKFRYNSAVSIFDLAAAYSFGIVKNHPFVDGNKRTAFTIGTVFFEINAYKLNASEYLQIFYP